MCKQKCETRRLRGAQTLSALVSFVGFSACLKHTSLSSSAAFVCFVCCWCCAGCCSCCCCTCCCCCEVRWGEVEGGGVSVRAGEGLWTERDSECAGEQGMFPLGVMAGEQGVFPWVGVMRSLIPAMKSITKYYNVRAPRSCSSRKPQNRCYGPQFPPNNCKQPCIMPHIIQRNAPASGTAAITSQDPVSAGSRDCWVVVVSLLLVLLLLVAACCWDIGAVVVGCCFTRALCLG